MTQTKYSISEAARRVNRNRATISRHLDGGKLSYEIDHQNRKVIDAMELIRVYGDEFQVNENGRGHAAPTARDPMPDRLIAELEKRIAHLETTNLHLHQTLEKALDIPPLLEDRRAKDSAWQATLDATIAKVTEQTDKQIATLEERRKDHEKELAVLKRALIAERKKSFWQKLFA